MSIKVKEIRYCQAWGKNTNARCKNRAIMGTTYCALHYPKKALIFEFVIILPLTIILTLYFNDPLIWALSKVPICYRLDKNAPRIETIAPDINKVTNVEKKTDIFKVSFLENESGIDYKKSYIKITYKGDQTNIPLSGKTNNMATEISFAPETELLYGEYLFDILLVDKANNKKELTKPFVVRCPEELTGGIASFERYENSPYKDIFNDFYENNKGKPPFSSNYFIYVLLLNNKEAKTFLKNLNVLITISGGVIYKIKEVGNLGGGKIVISNPSEAMDKGRYEGRVYLSQSYLQIDTIDPRGIVSLAILVGEDKLESNEKIWKGISLNGSYLSDGYGTTVYREVDFDLPVQNAESKLRSFGLTITNAVKGDSPVIFTPRQ